MIKSVVIGGVFSYPDGVAASSRIRNLALGFAQSGIEVKVVCMYNGSSCTAEPGRYNDYVEGFNIEYLTVTKYSKETSNLIGRISGRVIYNHKLSILVRAIINNARGERDELILLYGRSYSFLSSFLKKKNKEGLRSKVVFDIVEPPRAKKSKIEYIFHPFIWESSLIFKFNFLRNFDACIFISHALKEAFQNQVNRSIIVPAIKNYSGSEVDNQIGLVPLQIGYLGAFLEKDYPELLYKLCEKLERSNIDFHLKILGRFDNFSVGRDWRLKFERSSFASKIGFYSNPTDEEIVVLLEQVNFITLFRKPEYLQVFTFPTRVVEMLALKKVMIVNSFGDFTRYFKDGYNCVCLNDDDISNIASIISLYRYPEKYNKVLLNGMKLLANDFNPKRNVAKILKAFSEE